MVWRAVEDPQRDEGEYTIHGTFTEERDLRGSDNQIIVVVGFFWYSREDQAAQLNRLRKS